MHMFLFGAGGWVGVGWLGYGLAGLRVGGLGWYGGWVCGVGAWVCGTSLSFSGSKIPIEKRKLFSLFTFSVFV